MRPQALGQHSPYVISFDFEYLDSRNNNTCFEPYIIKLEIYRRTNEYCAIVRIGTLAFLSLQSLSYYQQKNAIFQLKMRNKYTRTKCFATVLAEMEAKNSEFMH